MEETTERVVERMGLVLEVDGLPRSAGRMLGYLLLSTEPRCLDRMSEDLLISKASASTNARLLERLGVLTRASRPGDRRDFYVVSPDLHVRILARRVERIRALLGVMSEARGAGPAGEPAVRERIETFSAFFEEMLDVVRAARQRWETEHGEHGEPDEAVPATG